MEKQFIFFPRLPPLVFALPYPFPHKLEAPHLQQSLVPCKMELMEQAAGAALA